MKISQRVITFSELHNIDTDRIIPGKYTKSVDYQEMATHTFEDLDPDFFNRYETGNIIAVGHNFGCGSSREQAAIVLKQCGVAAVIAQSFARIFYRNAINIGLPVIVMPRYTPKNGDHVSIDLSKGCMAVDGSQEFIAGEPTPASVQRLIEAGGMVPYLREHRTLKGLIDGNE